MKYFLLSILIMGCSHHTSQKSITGPDGTKHKLITCGAIEDCYNRAAELCGTYKIVNTSHDTSSWNDGKTSTTKQLLVKCDEKK